MARREKRTFIFFREKIYKSLIFLKKCEEKITDFILVHKVYDIDRKKLGF